MLGTAVIISVHLPKTGGSTFKNALIRHFGAGLKVKNDFPSNHPHWKRNALAMVADRVNAVRPFRTIQCIHGHFMARQFASMVGRPNVAFVTWLREPVDRMVSHYQYWQRKYSAKSQPLHHKAMRERWTFEEFCFRPEVQNIYSRTYLNRFPLDWFNFVGITEHYEEDFHQFAKVHLGNDMLGLISRNVNPDKASGPYPMSAELRGRIEAFHAEDMALYQEALVLRQRRLRELGMASDVP